MKHDYPKNVIAIYDNGNESIDHITVVFSRRFSPEKQGFHTCLGMSDMPFHPQGFCQHSTCQNGKHLGKKIMFSDLNADCQKAVLQALATK